MSIRIKGKGKRSGDKTSKCDSKNGIKRSKDTGLFEISRILLEDEVKQELKKAWSSRQRNDFELRDKCATVIKTPFNCMVLKDLIADENLIEEIKSELQCQHFHPKSNDLYKFVQSSDLKLVNSPIIEDMRTFLLQDVKPWLVDVTGIPLNDTIDMFCAKYDYSDYLLCHDDELEGRRIAYIIYFVPPWSDDDGGCLDLYDRDVNGCPKTIIRSLVPKINTMVCFEVTPESFHQVAEVLSKDKTRLSVGGWFHGKSVPRPPKHKENLSHLLSPVSISEEEFYGWINPQYLDPLTQSEIQSEFENNSEISLPNFLQAEKYTKLKVALKQLSSEQVIWKTEGPANKRCTDVLITKSEEGHSSLVIECQKIVNACLEFLTSDATFLLLSNITGLNLHPLATVESDSDDNDETVEEREGNLKATVSATTQHKHNIQDDQTSSTSDIKDTVKDEDKLELESGCNSKSKCAVRRWRKGCYTLLHDNDVEFEQQTKDGKGYSLDARLFFNCENWSISCGGYTSYVAKDEDEELLTASPDENTLTIVYKDSETLSFVKYVSDEINETVQNGQFNDIAVTYYE